MQGNIAIEKTGIIRDGQDLTQFKLSSPSGLKATFINLGATLCELWVPNRDGVLEDIVLGFDRPEFYISNQDYFGVTCGRVANRIRGAKFSLAGHEYRLEANEGLNTLHGGFNSLDKKMWKAEPYRAGGDIGIQFSYSSPSWEAGFPGTLEVMVDYCLRFNHELALTYRLQVDTETPVNLTNHSYFNLKTNSDILDHNLRISAQRYLPVDRENIPTGELALVEGTIMDFRKMRQIGEFRNDPVFGKGYDHTYILESECAQGTIPAAEVFEEKSGRTMTVYTTEPGIQLYTAQHLNKLGKNHLYYRPYAGFCLETQHFPDALHHAHFPSILRKPGVVYESTTRLAFSW